jgi:hypothetical protein
MCNFVVMTGQVLESDPLFRTVDEFPKYLATNVEGNESLFSTYQCIQKEP